MSTKKSESTAQVLDLIELPFPRPEPVEGLTLVEQGLYAILLRHLTPDQAQSALQRLQKRYPDWNELRIAQAREIALVMKGPLKKAHAAALDAKTYFQEVFQQSHGLDLEFLREDFQSAARFANQLSFLGLATANWLLLLATRNEVLVTPAIIRVLDRVGIVPRIASQKKARAAIEPLVPENEAQRFAMAIGHVAQVWCDPRKPICWECPLVVICRHGKKVKKDWLVQQERLEAQRKREELRQRKVAKQEDERRKREEAAAQKKAEAEAKKKQREDERRRKAEERVRLKRDREAERERKRKEKEQEREKLAKQREKEAAAKQKAAERARIAAEKKQAAAKKKAESKKAKAKPKTTRKASKTAARKTGRREKPKAATKKQSAAARSKTRKRTARKTGRKTTARKTTARKTGARKTTARKTTARKTGRKASGRKTGSKTTARKRPAAKQAAKRKTSRKRTTRRRR